MDSMDEESDFQMDGGSSDFEPVAVKPKAKAAPKAAAKKATTAKAAPKKLTQSTLKSKAAPKKKVKADSEDEDVADSALEDNAGGDESLLMDTPPGAKPKKVTKKAPAPKKKPLADKKNDADDLDEEAVPLEKLGDKYEKLTQLEHIIKRPDTYIGSVEQTTASMWVFNSETESMEFREVKYVPGLYKILDEILVNAADNKQNDSSMDEIRVTISRETGEISVWNNGRGIPIEIHTKEKKWVPEMIFGELLTSSNYDDEKAKVTGGRNGYGAKLCNIYSLSFSVETVDSRIKKKYKQTWTDNMSKVGKHKITDSKEKDYTKITFLPDYKRFGMEGIDDDFEALVKRRVYDLAGTAKVGVKLNGTKLPIRNFKKYMEMYTKAIKKETGEEDSKDTTTILTESPHARWEIGFAVSDGSFQHVSFVNSIATTSGGTHVNFIADQICTKLTDIVKKKNKTGAALKANQIRNHIFLFVNALIENPAFNSQTKEQLTSKSSQFGSKPVVSDEFLKKIAKTAVIDNIMHFAQQKADQLMKKSDGSRRSRMNNPKLIDANRAGTKDGHLCTLILTEGDSAKGLAVAGRAVVGPDLFGVFPLRGKLLNVRDASVDQISKNAEIQAIKSFMGLQHKKHYDDTKSLRYGRLMIMTDQDHDGSHIKGLLINFLQVAFPSLLRLPDFLCEFITPIVKVWKGDPKNPRASRSFFTLPEYLEWKEAHANEKWEHKYYKGLGTSSTYEAQAYFAALDDHQKEFAPLQDGEVELIERAFSKKKADERKRWLGDFRPGTFLDHSIARITYTDFINKELILFSMADNIRSIPSVVDGLKPGQRKVLHTAFKMNLKKDLKIAEFGGAISKETAYHHGEQSLYQTCINLAQDFVGSNNVICLEPSGNFGSRLQGGQDAASARYIFTRLTQFARKIFHKEDQPLLTHNVDDGKPIEPETFFPVVPMILLNGADGIGTGWSTSIPNYNPEDVVNNLKRMMDGRETEPMKPWFRGFTGEVVDQGNDRWLFKGIIKKTGTHEVEITELPVRVWTQDFKDRLEEIIKAEKKPSFIKDYQDYNTHQKVHFVIQLDPKNCKDADEVDWEAEFKLTKSLATSNMVAFDPEGRIVRYESVDDIMKEFFAVRLKMYEKRKAWLISNLQRELDKLTNQARFVQEIIDGKLIVSKKKKPVLVAELQKRNYTPYPKKDDAQKAGETEAFMEDEEAEADSSDETDVAASAYDYLLGMPIWSLTQERVEKLQKQIGEREVEMDEVIKLSKEDMWRRDLDDFIAEWRFSLEDDAKRAKKAQNMGRRASKKFNIPGKGAAKKRQRKDLGEDPDDSDFGAPKTKKAAASKATKQSGIKGFLDKPEPKKKSAADSLRAAMAAGSDGVMDLDGDDLSDFEAPPPKKNRAADVKEEEKPVSLSTTINKSSMPKTKAPAKKVVPVVEIEKKDESSDVDMLDDPVSSPPADKPKAKSLTKPKAAAAAAKPVKKAPAEKTTSRARAKKPISYGLTDSESDADDSGDDMLGDVSMMVKGIGSSKSSEASKQRALFSATSTTTRPGSSGGNTSALTAPTSLSRPKNKLLADLDLDDMDETDYSKLAPQESPRRSLLVTAKGGVLSGEEDEDDSLAAPTPAKKTVVTGRAKKAALPAPAKKLAKPAPKTNGKSKKALDSDDEVDAMANDILSEDDEDDSLVMSRPSRRAAAKKKTYVLESESEEESEEEEDDDEDVVSDDDDSE